MRGLTAWGIIRSYRKEPKNIEVWTKTSRASLIMDFSLARPLVLR